MARPKRKSSGTASVATSQSLQDKLYDSITVATATPSRAARRVATRSSAASRLARLEDEDDDDDSTGLVDSQSASSRTRPFAGVYIPVMPNSQVKRYNPQPQAATASTTSTNSSTSSDRENSHEYETPDTSAVVTPSNFSRASSGAVGKRKRPTPPSKYTSELADEMNIDGDESLALELQQAEYDLKSESETSPLSSMSSDESDSSVPVAKRKRVNISTIPVRSRKRTKPSVPLPRRPAKAGASKSSTALVDVISDSDSNSDFSSDSDVDSDIDSDDEPIQSKAVSKKTQTTTSSATSSRRGPNPSTRKKTTSSPTSESDSEVSLSLSESEDDIVTTGPAAASARNRWVERAERNRRRRALSERQKLELAHPELLTMWEDLEATPKVEHVKAEQPKSITRQLKGFQLEGLNWMQKQEHTKWKGGLLGDEMGMGKTIQAVSLIMSDYPAKHPTLVLVPPVALMQWTTEIAEYTSGKLKVLVYHGTNAKSKKMTVKELKQYDVIMISYNSLESLYRKETKGWNGKGQNQGSIIKEDSAIHAIHYHRLILDEAHSIKQRTTGVAKACFALKGTYKWCLSGTPVQNRVGEFFSLLRFLEVTPFANYFCKQCSCSALHWAMDARLHCKECKHRGLDHVSVFNQEILNPLTTGATDHVRKEALRKLRLLTDRIMLRRLKRNETTSMELPPKEVILHQEFFGEIERDFSSSIMSNTGRVFDTYVSRGVMLNNYANIFGLIMQMRQVADHPDLLLKRTAEAGQNVLVCHVCDEPAEEAIRSGCKHEFCRSCVKEYVRTCEAAGASPDCPKCHITLAIDFDQPDIIQDEESVKKTSIINRIKMENWTSSTKIEMLVYDLWKLRSKKHTTKSIVFSQFTSMLQLVEWRLRRAGFKTVMLDGSMTPVQRQKSIDFFMSNTDVEVFLVSLKAGGVALNLTEASRVFIVDPWWNPAAEWQSADRCHRIGQKRPCVITRLCVEDSVESRIVALQEKKAHMINGTVNNDDVAIERLTPEDMQFLFRGS